MTDIAVSGPSWACRCGSVRWRIVAADRRHYYCAECGWEWLPGRVPDAARAEQSEMEVGR